MATGPRFHNFVAGYYLSRFFRAPLVLEYRDEWSESPFTFVRQGNADRRWEKKCLRSADLVIFTTPSQLERNVATFHCGHGPKSHVVPNGWEPEDFTPPDPGTETPADEHRAAIAFIGTLGNHTLPAGFLQTLRRALEGADPALRGSFRLVFVGNKSPEAIHQLQRSGLEDLIVATEHIPKPEANRLMVTSRGLLLLNPVELHRYIPGKLYDYLAAGPPILVYGTGGEVERIVTDLDAGVIVPADDPGALLAALHRILPGGNRRRTEDRRRSEWLERHTREAAALTLIAHLEALAQSTRTSAPSRSTPAGD